MDSNNFFFPNTTNYDYYPNIENMENSEDFPNSGNQMNSQFSQDPDPSNSPQFRRTTQNSQPSHFQNTEPSKNSKKKEAQGWTDEQDIALMSAWCFVSENAITGKNQKEDQLWRCISEMYEQARVENPHKMGEQRSKESLRSRYRRLNTNATKWMGVFKKAQERATSGQSTMDIVEDAHKLYGKGGFPDINVYQKVMRHVPKWKVELHDRTRPRPDDDDFEEGHGSSKKSRTDEEGGNPMEATQASDASTINRPLGTGQRESKVFKERKRIHIASICYMRNRNQLTNREEHNSLKNDLIEHIWQMFGDGN